MYTFQIETIYDKNIIHSEIVGGGGKQFIVYRASDINKLFGDLNDNNYKTSIQAFTDGLSFDQLLDYYFSYIIYDTFEKELYRSFFFTTALQESIEKKLLKIQDIKKHLTYNDTEPVIKIPDNGKDNITTFCQRLCDLFNITSGEQNISIKPEDFLDDTTIVLSEGQYLNHLDVIYKDKYSPIIDMYRYHIDDIIEAEAEEDEDENEETVNRKKIIEKYNEEKQKLLTEYATYLSKHEIPTRDEIYTILHLLFINESFNGPNDKKSFLLMIDEKYEKLDDIKKQNLFYNNDKMFIRNKDEFLKNIQKKIKETFDNLAIHNGIEKLLNVYYAYIPHEASKDDVAIDELFNDLCEKISDFFIKNKNIYNLLLFNDAIFENMIKDDLILTLYDIEPKLEHKFGSIQDQGDNIIFDLQDGYVIDNEYIKQIMLYRYKNLEQKIRTIYLENYTIKDNKLVIDNIIYYSSPRFYEIINKRMIILRRGTIWPDMKRKYLLKMIDVINFYRKGRLLRYKLKKTDSESELEEGNLSLTFIGISNTLIDKYPLYTPDKIRILRIAAINESTISSSSELSNDDVDITDILETTYILCKKAIHTDTVDKKTQQVQTAWVCSNEVQITYEDMDLFDTKYDMNIYTVSPSDIKCDLTSVLTQELTPKLSYIPNCLLDRSSIIIDHMHRQKKHKHEQPTSGDQVNSDDFDEIIDLNTKTYVSIYKVNDGKTLENQDWFEVCNTKLETIKNILSTPNKNYDDINKSFCVLIEKVSDENQFVNSGYPCDMLFFIDEHDKNNILHVK